MERGSGNVKLTFGPKVPAAAKATIEPEDKPGKADLLDGIDQTARAASAEPPKTAIVPRSVADLTPVDYRGERVVTLRMVDEVHGRPEETAGRNFRTNRARLEECVDFYEVSQPDEIRRLGLARDDGGTAAKVILLTETGYLMLVKSFTDDLAWDVQRQLVNAYFKAKQAVTVVERAPDRNVLGGIAKGVIRLALARGP